MHFLSRRLPALTAAFTLLGCTSTGSTSGSAPLPRESASASFCDTPPLDSTAFHRVNRGGYSVGVPRGFTLTPGGITGSGFSPRS